jgi:hypothetical protein
MNYAQDSYASLVKTKEWVDETFRTLETCWSNSDIYDKNDCIWFVEYLKDKINKFMEGKE